MVFMVQVNKGNKLASAMWITILVLFFYQFIARSAFPTVLTEQFMKYFRIDATGMGMLTGCYYWVYTLMQIPAGVLADRVGLRRIAVISAGMCSGGVLLFISTSDPYVAGVGEVMLGFGSSFVFLMALKVISTYFPAEEVAMKSSLTMSVGCAGPVIGGPAVAFLVNHFDWISLIKVFAIFGLILTVILGIIMKNAESSEKQQPGEPLFESLKKVVTSRQLWILSLYSMAQYAPLSALGDLWGVQFLKKACEIDAATASAANNMLYVGIVIGAPVFAHLAGIWDSYKKPMIIGIVGETLGMALILMCNGLPLQAAFFLFFTTGFCSGSMLAFPLAAMIFPSSLKATVSGFVNMVCMVSGVILMPLVGYIVNQCWDGTVENGVKVYGINDFRLGLTSVLVFLAAGVVLSLMIEDRSPKK
jgi:MFS family permease